MTTIHRKSPSADSGYVSVLDRIPIADRNLQNYRPTNLKLSRTGHSLLATAAMLSVLVAPLVLPAATSLVVVLAGEVTRAPWSELLPVHPIGVGSGRR